MNIFVDTPAFLAVLNANDQFYPPAKQEWDKLLASDLLLFSSNYVILETTALLQHRFGIEAVRLFKSDILPVVEIARVDEAIHKQGMSALLVANRRDLSLICYADGFGRNQRFARERSTTHSRSYSRIS